MENTYLADLAFQTHKKNHSVRMVGLPGMKRMVELEE